MLSFPRVNEIQYIYIFKLNWRNIQYLKDLYLYLRFIKRTIGYVHTFIPEKINFLDACITRLHSLVGHTKMNFLD